MKAISDNKSLAILSPVLDYFGTIDFLFAKIALKDRADIDLAYLNAKSQLKILIVDDNRDHRSFIILP
jgi:hypothetical protein